MRMTTVAMSLLVAGLILAGAPGSEAALGPARQVPRVSGGDPAGDVVLTHAKGLSKAARRGVDMRRLTFSQRGRFVRVTMDVRRVDRSADLEQVYLVDISADGLDYGQLEVATHTESTPRPPSGLELSIVLEGTNNREGYVACYNLRHSLRDGARRWWVDIPRRCLPAGPATISAYSQTISGPTADDLDEKQFSHDRLRIPGRHRLGGTAQPARS